jgi:hypothetical protein
MSSKGMDKLRSLAMDVPAAVIGFQILAKGLEKLDELHHHPLVVTALLLLGGFVLLAALLPIWMRRGLPHAHALLHLAEGVAMSLSALILFEKGGLRIPIILVGAGLLYVAAGYLESRPPGRREQLAGPILTAIGCFILAGGVVLAVYTAFHDNDVWALGASGLFVVIGATLLLLRPRLLRHELPPSQQAEGGEPAAD